MRRSHVDSVLNAGLLLVALPGLATAQPAGLRQFLERTIQLTPQQVTTLNAGQVVVKDLPSPTKGEMAIFGAVRIDNTLARALEYLRALSTLEDGEVVLRIGRFSSPPTVDDVARLELDAEDVQALRGCRPGQCDFRLGVTGMDRLKQEIDWSAPDANSRLERLFRQGVVDYVQDYLTRGAAALVSYADAREAVRLAEQFRGVLDNSPYLVEYAPEFRLYLEEFPRTNLPEVRSAVFWSKVHFGLKPVITINHVIVWQDPKNPHVVLVGNKQLYANHYFDASLAVTAVLADPAAPDSPGVYVVYVNRSRADLLKGGFGGLARSFAIKEARKGAELSLQSLKEGLESAGWRVK